MSSEPLVFESSEYIRKFETKIDPETGNSITRMTEKMKNPSKRLPSKRIIITERTKDGVVVRSTKETVGSDGSVIREISTTDDVFPQKKLLGVTDKVDFINEFKGEKIKEKIEGGSQPGVPKNGFGECGKGLGDQELVYDVLMDRSLNKSVVPKIDLRALGISENDRKIDPNLKIDSYSSNGESGFNSLGSFCYNSNNFNFESGNSRNQVAECDENKKPIGAQEHGGLKQRYNVKGVDQSSVDLGTPEQYVVVDKEGPEPSSEIDFSKKRGKAECIPSDFHPNTPLKLKETPRLSSEKVTKGLKSNKNILNVSPNTVELMLTPKSKSPSLNQPLPELDLNVITLTLTDGSVCTTDQRARIQKEQEQRMNQFQQEYNNLMSNIKEYEHNNENFKDGEEDDDFTLGSKLDPSPIYSPIFKDNSAMGLEDMEIPCLKPVKEFNEGGDLAGAASFNLAEKSFDISKVLVPKSDMKKSKSKINIAEISQQILGDLFPKDNSIIGDDEGKPKTEGNGSFFDKSTYQVLKGCDFEQEEADEDRRKSCIVTPARPRRDERSNNNDMRKSVDNFLRKISSIASLPKKNEEDDAQKCGEKKKSYLLQDERPVVKLEKKEAVVPQNVQEGGYYSFRLFGQKEVKGQEKQGKKERPKVEQVEEIMGEEDGSNRKNLTVIQGTEEKVDKSVVEEEDSFRIRLQEIKPDKQKGCACCPHCLKNLPESFLEDLKKQLREEIRKEMNTETKKSNVFKESYSRISLSRVSPGNNRRLESSYRKDLSSKRLDRTYRNRSSRRLDRSYKDITSFNAQLPRTPQRTPPRNHNTRFNDLTKKFNFLSKDTTHEFGKRYTIGERPGGNLSKNLNLSRSNLDLNAKKMRRNYTYNYLGSNTRSKYDYQTRDYTISRPEGVDHIMKKYSGKINMRRSYFDMEKSSNRYGASGGYSRGSRWNY